MNMRSAAVASTTIWGPGRQRLEANEQSIGSHFSAGRDTEPFPEKRSQVSIHGNGSFEGSGCVLANTNLNVLTAVFYWFTLTCDEPKKAPSGEMGQSNSLIMECSVLWSVENENDFTYQKCS